MAHPKTTKLEEARARILAAAGQLATQTEMLPVMQANGRILAEQVISQIDLPQTANAAVDGFAIFTDKLQESPDRPMKIVGMARAGHPYIGTVNSGEAVRIYTGAMVPEGPDAIIMHEDCTEKATGGSDSIICNTLLKRGTNIRPAGENLAAGECVADKGQRITPAYMGQLAASGAGHVNVYRRLKVVLFSTGDEVIEAGQPLQAGQIYDSNRPILAGLLSGADVELIDGGIIRDNKADLISAYEEGLAQADIILSSGGASDGIEDHSQQALSAVAAEKLFWRLAMKPGRPMAAAVKGGRFIFCLPGNPVAAFVCFKLLIAPAIDKLSGANVRVPLALKIAAGFTHKKAAGRAEYLRAVIKTNTDGSQKIALHGRKGAGVISSLTGADGLVEIPLDCVQVHEGDLLNFIPFQEQVL